MTMTKTAKPGPVEAAPEKDAVPGTASFGKFVAVLQIIADEPGLLGIRELVERAALPRPTVYRIVSALRAEGLIRSDAASGRFGLGPRLINLASQSWATFDLRSLAVQELQTLREKTGETVHLAVPSGMEMIYIDKLESPQSVRMTSRIGTRVMLHASSVGKSYLAALPAKDLDALLDKVVFVRRTAKTIMNRRDLEAALAAARKRGYATDLEETEIEIMCLGAAVCNEAGVPLGGVSISVPKYRFDRAARAQYPALLVQCVDAIAKKVAMQMPPHSG